MVSFLSVAGGSMVQKLCHHPETRSKVGYLFQTKDIIDLSSLYETRAENAEKKHPGRVKDSTEILLCIHTITLDHAHQ